MLFFSRFSPRRIGHASEALADAHRRATCRGNYTFDYRMLARGRAWVATPRNKAYTLCLPEAALSVPIGCPLVDTLIDITWAAGKTKRAKEGGPKCSHWLPTRRCTHRHRPWAAAHCVQPSKILSLWPTTFSRVAGCIDFCAIPFTQPTKSSSR